MISFSDSAYYKEFLQFHIAAFIGLPDVFVDAMLVVVLLRQAEGPIEFKAFGFEFRGAPGQVVMWVFVFLALVFATKLLY